jgi:hypothetical protein
MSAASPGAGQQGEIRNYPKSDFGPGAERKTGSYFARFLVNASLGDWLDTPLTVVDCRAAVNSFFTTRLIKMKDELRTFKNVDQGDRLAIAVHHDCLGANALAKIW